MPSSVHYLFFVAIDGFSDTSYTWSPFVQGSGAIHLNYIHCTGSEYKLVDCSSNRNTWSHFADWSITCNNGIFLHLSTGCFMLCKKIVQHSCIISYPCLFYYSVSQKYIKTVILHIMLDHTTFCSAITYNTVTLEHPFLINNQMFLMKET